MKSSRQPAPQPKSSDQLQQNILRKQHWRRTLLLMRLMVVIALAMIIASPIAATYSEFPFKLFGFPLGLFLVAQGTVVIIIAAVFWFSVRQDKIDQETGMGEQH